MTLGNKIAELRKEKGMTQEALANVLAVSNQAVSKWEANQSCPDVQLLPQIADVFEVTLDALFGRESTFQCEINEEISLEENDDVKLKLPWKDDGKLRAVIYMGHSLVAGEECAEAEKIRFEYDGPALDITSSFSVTCDEVRGNVEEGGNVTCDDVTGSVNAGGNVTCDAINGNVNAGGNIICDEIGGNVIAGGNIS